MIKVRYFKTRRKRNLACSLSCANSNNNNNNIDVDVDADDYLTSLIFKCKSLHGRITAVCGLLLLPLLHK